MRTRTVEIKFPLLGVARRTAIQSQPPFWSPAALNVRGRAAGGPRHRGGMRPGCNIAIHETLGSGNPIRLLNSVRLAISNDIQFWSDSFDSTAFIGNAWAAHASTGGDEPEIFRNDFLSQGTSGLQSGYLYRDALSIRSGATTFYQVEMFIVPYLGQHWGTYRILARMNDATPNHASQAMIGQFTPSANGTSSWAIRQIIAGVETPLASGTVAATYPEAGWLSLRVENNSISLYWRGTLLGTGAASAMTGTRVGLEIEPNEQALQQGGRMLIDSYRIQYQESYSNSQIPITVRNVLIGSSNGSIWKEYPRSAWLAVSTTRKLSSRYSLSSAERLSKLYIADYDYPLASGTDGVRGTGNDRLDAASYADWTTVGISPVEDYVVEITSAAGGGLNGVYAISAVVAGEITLANNWNAGAGTCSYRIIRSPKIFDPAANTLTNWIVPYASMGNGTNVVPLGCPIVALWRDRLILAGAYDAPNRLYMSRIGDPLDWDYSAPFDDDGRPIAGQTTQAGIIGEAITAVIPGGDDYLIVSGSSSLWVCRGDPAANGQIDNISRTLGVVGRGAWCFGPNGEIYFLSREGMYVLPPGGGAPRSLSYEKIPDGLVNLTDKSATFSMAYDVRDRGVHIFVSGEQSNDRTHYFYDVESDAFWPVQFKDAATQEPLCVYTYHSDCPEDSCVVLGSRDGIARRFLRHYTADDNDGIDSYICIGPLVAWNESTDGLLQRVEIVLSDVLGGATIGVYSGMSGEEAVLAATDDQAELTNASATAVLETGRNLFHHLRVRGPYLVFKIVKSLTSDDNDDWTAFALEGFSATFAEAGPIRRIM